MTHPTEPLSWFQRLVHWFPHIGMRKVKSVLSVFLGFCIWQLLRLILPSLEMHPLFVYVYALIEIRDTSEKTSEFGKTRIKTTFVGLGTGLPLLALSEYLQGLTSQPWMQHTIEMLLILTGVLLALIIAEKLRCKTFCGLAAAICIILMVTHSNGEQYLYSILRSIQTLIGVFVAWLINVKWFPYHGKTAGNG